MSRKLLLAAALVALAMAALVAEAQTAGTMAEVAAGGIFRRRLQQRDRYISYEALRADSIPCGWVGNSYYDCSYHKQLNPYRRGCTTATRCFRYTH